jgi:hypothetical protein
VGGLRLDRPAEGADLAAFLGRVAQLERSALVRLRTTGQSTTGYVRLPFGVLVSRSALVQEAPADVTVAAAALLAALEAAGPDGLVGLPARRDADWRGQLPPAGGWQLLDTVPAAVVARLVHAGAEAVRSAGAGGAASESLLDQETLTVAGGGQTAGLPLRVLSAAWRMGFLGDVSAPRPPVTDVEPPAAGGEGAAAPGPQVAVSVSGGWVRLAAPYGSAYHRVASGLVLRPRLPAAPN